MRKKFLTMFLVGAMALSITACGGKETEEASNTPSQPTVEQNVEENVANDNQQETVVEGDAPIDDDVNYEDGEIIDLTNTSVLNVTEKLGNTLNLPVYKFAYSEENAYGISYIANNVDEGGKYLEFYQLSVTLGKENISPADAYAKMESYSTDYGSDYVKTVNGDENSAYIVMSLCSQEKVDGTVKKIDDVYFVYDSSVSAIYELELRINKDAEVFGADIMEKSTATYREELSNTLMALAN